MSNSNLTIHLTTTFGSDAWELELPATVTVAQLMQKLTGLADIGLASKDTSGRVIDYELMWQEGERVVRPTETLDSAGVRDGDNLIIRVEEEEANDISIHLTTALGLDIWVLWLPITTTTRQLISKLITLTEIGLASKDADGRVIDYELMWQEGDRTLDVAETLYSAGVRHGHNLIIRVGEKANDSLIQSELTQIRELPGIMADYRRLGEKANNSLIQSELAKIQEFVGIMAGYRLGEKPNDFLHQSEFALTQKIVEGIMADYGLGEKTNDSPSQSEFAQVQELGEGVMADHGPGEKSNDSPNQSEFAQIQELGERMRGVTQSIENLLLRLEEIDRKGDFERASDITPANQQQPIITINNNVEARAVATSDVSIAINIGNELDALQGIVSNALEDSKGQHRQELQKIYDAIEKIPECKTGREAKKRGYLARIEALLKLLPKIDEAVDSSQKLSDKAKPLISIILKYFTS